MHGSMLIVEDDLDQLAILKRWFIKAGYEVTGVHHPRLALAAAALHPFEVAIVHQDLPEIDGITLMHKLHRLGGDMRVIVQSYDATAAESNAAGEPLRALLNRVLSPCSNRSWRLRLTALSSCVMSVKKFPNRWLSNVKGDP